MLGWTLIFFLVALVAAMMGYTNIALGAAAIARVLFILFLVLFIASLVIELLRRRRPR
jgi:uncharacterized membrane protein YtjA (UPF0391 family)